MGKIRTVSFYRLSVEVEEDIPQIRQARRRSYEPQDVEALFVRIRRENMRQLHSGTYASNVRTTSNQYYVENLSYFDHKAFFRIGQPNPTNAVGLRDNVTLESSDVPMTDTQSLELYTYCLIDFLTLIVSYIGVSGAPKISALKELFNLPFTPRDHTNAWISSIMTRDIINEIVRKDMITSFDISVSVPCDEILSEVYGLNPQEFDNLQNVKRGIKKISVVATRNRNIFEHKERGLNSMFTSVRERFGDRLRTVKVKAKDADEEIQVYDLLSYNITKKVNLNEELDHNQLTVEMFVNALENTYNANREELVMYARNR